MFILGLALRLGQARGPSAVATWSIINLKLNKNFSFDPVSFDPGSLDPLSVNPIIFIFLIFYFWNNLSLNTKQSITSMQIK